MKLLPKKEIAAIKLKEKQLEAGEGMKLAKKVDALRETFQKEQADLIKFRDENVKKILEEIKKYSTKKDTLAEDIKVLEDRRKEALKPLDEEKEELEAMGRDLEELNKKIDRKEKEVCQFEKLLFERNIALKTEEDRIKDIKGQTIKLQEETQNLKNQTASTYQEAEQMKVKLIAEVQVKSNELAQRETDIMVRERDMKVKEGLMIEKEKEFIRIKAQLADQRGTLERAFIRLKK